MFDTGCYNSGVGSDWLQQGTKSRTSKSQSHHNNGRDCPIGFISRFNSIGIYKTLFFENRNNEQGQVHSGNERNFLQAHDIWLSV